jgi:hypothetical protein
MLLVATLHDAAAHGIATSVCNATQWWLQACDSAGQGCAACMHRVAHVMWKQPVHAGLHGMAGGAGFMRSTGVCIHWSSTLRYREACAHEREEVRRSLLCNVVFNETSMHNQLSLAW